MKKYLSIFTLILLLFFSCSKNDDYEEPEKVNIFINTSWTADDDIASLIYGNGCTTTIEFLTETECQVIDYIPKGIFSGTKVKKGTYTTEGNNVSWTIEELTISGTASGSVLSTDMNTVSGEKRIYRIN